jgi:lipoprotein-releasing system ATP-binding protein
MSEVLSLSAISRSYATSHGPLEVLRHANLSLSRGELVALIGPSGSGKSTLLHIAGLLDSPQSGSIHIAGVDASHANDAVRTRLRNQHIGFIYQFHNLLPELSALENVMMPSSKHNQAIAVFAKGGVIRHRRDTTGRSSIGLARNL